MCEGRPEWCSEEGEGSSLEEMSEDILKLLCRYDPVVVPGMDPSLHYLAPHIPKATWTALGNVVVARERSSSGSVDGSRWISLRLDGSGFSRAVRMMRNKGVLQEEGFSETFAACMQSCLRALMEHFQAQLGYTQSDEMIVFIAPTSIVRGERQVHHRGGRVTKLTTLAAGFVTAHFVMYLAEACVRRGVSLQHLQEVLPHFDCRLGHYSSWEEARALLLWRAADCSVNGISDAVYQVKGSGRKVQELNKRDKLEWLWKQGLLPLPRHQAYGTVLAKVRRACEGYNPKTETTTKTTRGVIEHVDGPVLELARQGALIPPDDVENATPRQ